MTDEAADLTTVAAESVETTTDSELEGKIIDQVEYYFGDINLGRDKFLKEEVKKDDGWIPLETMLKFKRLEALTKDAAVIAEALRKSDLMEVSEDNKKIRRSVDRPLRNLTREELTARSIYAKGFPLDVTLDQVKAFFKQFGETDSIYMRKDLRKRFKGSCFVVFRNEASAKKFIETPDVKYNDTEMIRLLKDDYFKKKNAEKKQKTEDKVKKSDELKQEKDREEKEKVKEKMTAGAILSIEGIPKATKREDIKTFFLKFGSVEWIDFDSGDCKARVRFGAQDEAKTALEKAKEENDGKVKISEAEVECRVLEGEEELDHWAGIHKARRDRLTLVQDRKKKNWRGGDRRGDRRGGPQRKRAKHSANKEDSDDDKDDDDDE